MVTFFRQPKGARQGCRMAIPRCPAVGRVFSRQAGFRAWNAACGVHPTCVGNTCPCSWPRRSGSVHPHVCGEHVCVIPPIMDVAGSSPRVWGTRTRTPARRGAGAVHPHVCGEHALLGGLIGGRQGSSPRVWGTPAPRGNSSLPPRFIPTCVGNTAGSLSWARASSVHPHVCGEHGGIRSGGRWLFGSSPRVWGTHGGGLTIPPAGRFIPTCVGNTH